MNRFYLPSRRPGHPVPEVHASVGLGLDLDALWSALVELGIEPSTRYASRGSAEGASPARPFDVGGEHPLVSGFRAAGWLGRELGNDRFVVRCPWESRHSAGSRNDTSTVLWRNGGFHCAHAHCDGRSSEDVVEAIPPPARRAYERARIRSLVREPPSLPAGVLELEHRRFERLSEAESYRPTGYRLACEWAAEKPGRAAIFAGALGLGKSVEAGKWMAEELSAGGAVSYSAPSHKIADEMQERLESASIPVDRRSGLLRILDETGKPACQRPDVVTAAAAKGYAPRTYVCARCEHQKSYRGTARLCPAYQAETQLGAQIVVDAQVQALAGRGELRGNVLIVDELAEFLTHSDDGKRQGVPVDELRSIVYNKLSGAGWAISRAPVADLILRSAAILQAEWDRTPSQYPLRVWGMELREALLQATTSTTTSTTKDGRTPEDLVRELANPFQAALTAPILSIRAPSGEVTRADFWDSPLTPRRDLDDLIGGLLREAGFLDPMAGETACLVVDGFGARIERRVAGVRSAAGIQGPSAGSVTPRSIVVLDATAQITAKAIRSALPGWEIGIVRVDVQPDPRAVRRVLIVAKGLSRHNLETKAARARGWPSVCRVLEAIFAQVRYFAGRPLTVGVITHMFVADALRKAWTAVARGDRISRGQDAARGIPRILERAKKEGILSELRVGHYGAERGTNDLEGCDVLAAVGDPWINVGGAGEDARTLGLTLEEYARARLDASIEQALGRARAIRRTAEKPLLLIYAGREIPLSWSDPDDVEILASQGAKTAEGGAAIERLAGWMIEALGAVGAALMTELLKSPDLIRHLEQRDTMGIERDLIAIASRCSEGRDPPSRRAIQRATKRAAGHLPAVTVPDPSRPVGQGGHWKLYEREPGAAGRIERAIRAARVAPVSANLTDVKTSAPQAPGESGGSRVAQVARRPKVSESADRSDRTGGSKGKRRARSWN
jgi:hypothetical protein